MTLIFNRLLEVVKVHVHAELHQAKCSGSCSWVRPIAFTKFDDVENNTAVASVGSYKY